MNNFIQNQFFIFFNLSRYFHNFNERLANVIQIVV
nr:MAG TPA: hypothetical protein [Caudoviricetes sp.]